MELAGRKLYFVQFVFIVKGTQTVHTLPNKLLWNLVVVVVPL